MGKGSNKKNRAAEFLALMLKGTGKAKETRRTGIFNPPDYKPGFIVKPTNPGWVKALDRKMRMYADRIARCTPYRGNPWLGFEVDGEIFDKTTAQCKQRMIEVILEKGEVNVEEFWKKAQEIGIDRWSYQRDVVRIIEEYCLRGGKDAWSIGGFLPTDENYDASFV